MATSVGCARLPQLINEPADSFKYNPCYWAGRTHEGTKTGWFNYHQVGWADVYDAAITFPSLYPLPPIAVPWGFQPGGYGDLLWAGEGTQPYRWYNPTLTVSYDTHAVPPP